MVSSSRLNTAQSIPWTAAAVPFLAVDGTLLLRDQARSCLIKDCSVIFPLGAVRAPTTRSGSSTAAVSQIPPSRIGQRSGCARGNLRLRHGPGGGGSPMAGVIARALGHHRYVLKRAKVLTKCVADIPPKLKGGQSTNTHPMSDLSMC